MRSRPRTPSRLAAQPVPLDWPGYLDEGLPLIIGAVAALLPVTVGLWLKLGDADGFFGRVGLVLSLVGHGAWLLALAAAVLRIEYGAITAIAATIAMVGTASLGVALVGRARVLLGALVALAALAGVGPPGIGWPLFAARVDGRRGRAPRRVRRQCAGGRFARRGTIDPCLTSSPGSAGSPSRPCTSCSP